MRGSGGGGGEGGGGGYEVILEHEFYVHSRRRDLHFMDELVERSYDELLRVVVADNLQLSSALLLVIRHIDHSFQTKVLAEV